MTSKMIQLKMESGYLLRYEQRDLPMVGCMRGEKDISLLTGSVMSTQWSTDISSWSCHTTSNMSSMICTVSSHASLLFFYPIIYSSELSCPKRGMEANWKFVERTSENAGAVIFLYLFHSSPSDAMIFRLKNKRTLYLWPHRLSDPSSRIDNFLLQNISRLGRSLMCCETRTFIAPGDSFVMSTRNLGQKYHSTMRENYVRMDIPSHFLKFCQIEPSG
jgi:hypothetical protein